MLKNNYDIIVIGGGVSGLFTSYLLSEYTNCRIGLLDAGVEFRCRNADNSVANLRGIGGAGTLHGGKLCNAPASGAIWKKTASDLQSWQSFIEHLPLSSKVAQSLISTGTAKASAIQLRDSFHAKSFYSVALLRAEMREFIDNLVDLAAANDVDILTSTAVEKIMKKNGCYIVQFEGKRNPPVIASKIVVATGRSSAASMSTLLTELNVALFQQAPDLGIRLETSVKHSEMFSKEGQDTKIKKNSAGFNIRTFCVCTGGSATKVKLDSTEYFDGHFSDKLTNTCNIGIMARNDKIIGYKSAIDYCKILSSLESEPIAVSDLPKIKRNLTRLGHNNYADAIHGIYLFLNEAVNGGIFDDNINSCRVNLPAIDRYWPRVPVDSNFETSSKGLYVVGDAIGISRGYLQSLWSGWCCSNHIISAVKGETKYNNIRKSYEVRIAL